MKPDPKAPRDEFDIIPDPEEDTDAIADEDLWFLPGPLDDSDDDLPPGPRADLPETSLVDEWIAAEAQNAARLATVAGKLGALDDRLLRGPEGWQHRLALIEAADLSWFAGDRISADRLGLWMSLRLSGVQDDPKALARISWAVRRLTGGPEPETDLAAFLDRRDPENMSETSERFEDRQEGWLDVMATASDLHPISRACMGFHLWGLSGLGLSGDQVEAAVTSARIAAGTRRGAIFVPLAMGGAGGLRAIGTPKERLMRWLNGMENAVMTAMRHLEAVDAWDTRAEVAMSCLSGRTPAALRRVLAEWPMVSAPMAESLTGASRAAVQRNLTWMQNKGLIREVTGQGRFRVWKIVE